MRRTEHLDQCWWRVTTLFNQTVDVEYLYVNGYGFKVEFFDGMPEPFVDPSRWRTVGSKGGL